MAAEPIVVDLIRPDAAMRLLAATLNVSETRATALLSTSGIPTQQIFGRTVMHRADVTAYTRHLAAKARRVPVGGGPDIGYEAERAYRDGQDDQ